MTMIKNRTVYFDILRLIATFAVIMIHVSAQGTDNNILSFTWCVSNIYNSISRFGVPVFVMISGALFLGKEVSIKKLFSKNILRLIIAFYVWSTLYALWAFFITKTLHSVQDVIAEIIAGPIHLWFLFMIIGLYIVSPFLKKIITNPKLAVYFVALSFLFAFFLPQFVGIIEVKFSGIAKIINSILTKTNIHLVLGYSGYYVLGYLLYKTKLKKHQEIIIYLLGIAGSLITIFGTAYFSVIQENLTVIFYEYLSVNILFESLAVFTFAKHHLDIPLRSVRKQNLLSFFSKCTFGVYLIHWLIIKMINSFTDITVNSFNPIISIPIISLSVFLVSLAISIFLNKLPAVNKWIV